MTLVELINDSWGWTGVKAVEVHAQSSMGHLLFSDLEGCYYYLDTDGLKIETLGNSQATERHFAEQETKEIWSGGALVDAARTRLGDPPAGHVYTLEPAALLEGHYSPESMCILPLEELIRFTGSAAQQLKDLPDGSKFELKVVD